MKTRLLLSSIAIVVNTACTTTYQVAAPAPLNPQTPIEHDEVTEEEQVSEDTQQPADMGLPLENTPSCEVSAIEESMRVKLLNLATDVDFSLLVQREDGRQFVFNRGDSKPTTQYESASTSKMVTAAIILRLVERGVLKFTDQPQKYLANWPIPETDSLYRMNLSHLLSFTSGLEVAPTCIDNPFANFENCVANVALANKGNGRIPGSTYYYGSPHLQVAGLMAVKAAGKVNWQALYSDFQMETGLFSNSQYNLPSPNNPRLAGGMSWTGQDYLGFLLAYRDGRVINDLMFKFATSDKIADAKIISAPALSVIGEAWHYGYGLWIECNSPVYNCSQSKVVSSPGAYGAYPFIDVQTKLTGIIARQGELGSFGDGFELYTQISSDLRIWEGCK